MKIDLEYINADGIKDLVSVSLKDRPSTIVTLMNIKAFCDDMIDHFEGVDRPMTRIKIDSNLTTKN